MKLASMEAKTETMLESLLVQPKGFETVSLTGYKVSFCVRFE
jgi:hypothetical protein